MVLILNEEAVCTPAYFYGRAAAYSSEKYVLPTVKSISVKLVKNALVRGGVRL